jgi:predicted NodU family carbamoyl transferase
MECHRTCRRSGDRRWNGPSDRHEPDPLERRHEDVAASLQRWLEEIVLEMLRELHASAGSESLVSPGAWP